MKALLTRADVEMVLIDASVQRLLRAGKVALWSWRRADAYVRQFPAVTRVDIPEGGFDLMLNLPAHDTTLLALKASLVASADIANVRLEQRGRGQQSEAQAMGWLGRVFLSLMPL